MGRRRLARETALQALYLTDISGLGALEAYGNLGPVDGLDEKSSAFAKDLVEGATAHRSDIDGRIQSTADNWELKRMAAVDRSLLRLATYELLYHKDTPASVVIDEAIEIAKKFSAEDSPRFINGILDKIKDFRVKDGPPKGSSGP